jgi:hypothetical protein
VLLMLGLLVAGVGLMARSLAGAGLAEDDHGGLPDVRETVSTPSGLPRAGRQPLSGVSVEEELAQMRARKATVDSVKE